LEFLSILLLIILISGCAAAQNGGTQGAINLEDGLGRQVTLSEPAQRIVSLSPSVTEILFAIGAGEQVIGRDSFRITPLKFNPSRMWVDRWATTPLKPSPACNLTW